MLSILYLKNIALPVEEYGTVGGVKFAVQRAMPLETRSSSFNYTQSLVLTKIDGLIYCNQFYRTL